MRNNVDRLLRWTALVVSLYAGPMRTSPLRAQEPPRTESGQPTNAPQEPEAPASIREMEQIEARLGDVTAQLGSAEGFPRRVLEARYERELDQLISLSQRAARTFLRRRAAGGAQPGEGEQITAVIARLPSWINLEIERIIGEEEIPRPDQTALEQAAFNARIRVQSDRQNKLMNDLIANNAIGRELGLDVTSDEEAVRQNIVRWAEGVSDYLFVALGNLSELRLELAALPENEELRAKINVTESHVRLAADVMRRLSARMKELGLDTSSYDAQVISATGAMTTDILRWSVFRGLLSRSLANVRSWISDKGAAVLFRVFLFLVLLLASWKAAGFTERLTLRALGRSRVHLSQLLRRTVVSAARSVVLILGILIALAQLGISLGPALTGLGIAGFIVGFALQDSLSNFASGILILLYRPFDLGDFVELSGATGTVSAMSLVNTTVLTIDNRRLVVPNNQVWRNVIKNLTAQATRRVDMVFGISYSDDIEKAERILGQIVTEHEKVLPDPRPVVRLHELGESSVNFVVRPWVRTDDYWDVYWDVTRRVKVRFDEEGITIPFPQRDMHLHRHRPGEFVDATDVEARP